MLQPARGNVLAIVHAVEADLHYGVIGPLDRVGQILSARSHTQHATAGGVIRAIAPVGSGVENLHPLQAVGFFNPADALSRLERAGIPS